MNIQKIPVSQIVLDERNPRVAHVMEDVKDGNPQDLIPLALGQHAPESEEGGSSTTFSSLKASIRAHRRLIVPIIVTPRGDGSYTVIEGNTRVQIFRELAEEESPGDWSTIPADIQTSLDEAGEHAIRLQAHLVGPRQWRPYAKARYLHELYIKHNKSITEIIEFCGGNARRKEIERYIAAFVDMQQHYLPLVRAEGGRPDYSCFSSFVELQAIKPSLIRTNHTVADFAEWCTRTVCRPSSWCASCRVSSRIRKPAGSSSRTMRARRSRSWTSQILTPCSERRRWSSLPRR